MLGDEENFPATGENSDNVGVREGLGSGSHVLFCTEELVEAFDFGVFIDKYYLPTILYHTMTSIAEKGKDNFMGIAFEKTIQVNCHLVTVFHTRFYQGQKFIRSKTKSGDQLLKVAVVSENPR